MKRQLKISAEAQNNKAVIRIDGYISDWNNHAAGFKAQLDQLIANGITEAEIYINSGGGSCFQANEIANELLRFTGSKVARLGALCASAATYITSKCDTVIAAKNNSYMIHKPWGDVSGNKDEIQSQLKLLENLTSEYASAYAAKTGLSVSKIESMWIEDYWMNSTEAKTLGFVDQIEGEATITPEDVTALQAFGYKNMPKIEASVKPTDTNPHNNIMKNLIITALALSATLSDNEVVAKVEELKAKAAKADELERQLQETTATARKEKIDAVITTGLAKKQISASQEAYYRKQLNANFDETKAHIEALPSVVQLSTATSGANASGGVDHSKWTYADYQEKDPKALAELAKNKPEEFEKLFNDHYSK